MIVINVLEGDRGREKHNRFVRFADVCTRLLGINRLKEEAMFRNPLNG